MTAACYVRGLTALLVHLLETGENMKSCPCSGLLVSHEDFLYVIYTGVVTHYFEDEGVGVIVLLQG